MSFVADCPDFENWDDAAADELDGFEDIAQCRVCGCSNLEACANGCFWVEPDLCSACAARAA